eukprot:ctg_510.g310
MSRRAVGGSAGRDAGAPPAAGAHRARDRRCRREDRQQAGDAVAACGDAGGLESAAASTRLWQLATGHGGIPIQPAACGARRRRCRHLHLARAPTDTVLQDRPLRRRARAVACMRWSRTVGCVAVTDRHHDRCTDARRRLFGEHLLRP